MTLSDAAVVWEVEFLLTRPSRDVTIRKKAGDAPLNISTHTPLAGRDNSLQIALIIWLVFLLTRPSRDVTSENFLLFTLN